MIDFEEPRIQENVNGAVVAVCVGDEKGEPKTIRDVINLKSGHGVKGDAHAGTDREVSLLTVENVRKFTEETGIDAPPGCFAENIRIKWHGQVEEEAATGS